MKVDILQSDKLIAEFMGGTIRDGYASPHYEYVDFRDENEIINETVRVDNLRYNDLWDWLMPVVQKILSINQETMETYSLYLEDSLRSADIKNVYKSVVNYIEWHNSQQL